MKFHLTPKSGNQKTGLIPVTTTSGETCPPECPFAGKNGCYAESGPLALHWRKVTEGKRGENFPAFLGQLENTLSSLPPRQLWRHNQAGDLPGKGSKIDVIALAKIVAVNARTFSRGYTYTHKPMASVKNRMAVQSANISGFAVNLSGNSLAHADELAALEIAPVVCVVPLGTETKELKTPGGRAVIVCPAQTGNATCATCGLCAVRDPRRPIVAFLAHGTGAKKVSAIATN